MVVYGSWDVSIGEVLAIVSLSWVGSMIGVSVRLVHLEYDLAFRDEDELLAFVSKSDPPCTFVQAIKATILGNRPKF